MSLGVIVLIQGDERREPTAVMIQHDRQRATSSSFNSVLVTGCQSALFCERELN